MMIFTNEIYLQDTDDIYNEALKFYGMKKKMMMIIYIH